MIILKLLDYIKNISKIVLIATNPKFIQKLNWRTAIPIELFDLFSKNLKQNTEKTLKKFCYFQIIGMISLDDCSHQRFHDTRSSQQ